MNGYRPNSILYKKFDCKPPGTLINFAAANLVTASPSRKFSHRTLLRLALKQLYHDQSSNCSKHVIV